MARRVTYILLSVLAVVMLLPLLYVLEGSLMSSSELAVYLKPILEPSTELRFVSWTLLPQIATLQGYVELLLDTPEFFAMFWNSVKIAVAVLAGQLLVGAPAAWGFSRMQGKAKEALFFLYVLLMMMPFQVTLLSNYITLNTMGLLDSQWGIILPAAFSTFPVFIMYRFFESIPQEIVEAARVDGAGEWRIFFSIGIPLGSSGIVSALVLSFLEVWNMIEQPLAFLANKSLWPLSLYFPEISLSNAEIMFASSVVALIPALLVFLAGQRQLEEGIMAIATKR